MSCGEWLRAISRISYFRSLEISGIALTSSVVILRLFSADLIHTDAIGEVG